MKGLLSKPLFQKVHPAVWMGLLLLLLLPLLPALRGGGPPAVVEVLPTVTAAPPTPRPPTPVPTPVPAAIPVPVLPAVVACSFDDGASHPSPDPARGYPPPTATEAPRPTFQQVGLNAPLRLAFDRPVSLGWLRGNVVLEPPAEGHFQTEDEQTFLFIPRPAWQPATHYRVTLKNVRNPWSEVTFSTLSPAWVGFATRDRDGLAPSSAVILYLAQPVECDRLAGGLYLEPPTPFHLEWADCTARPDPEQADAVVREGTEVYLVPEEEWALDTTYTLTLALHAFLEIPSPSSPRWNFSVRSAVIGFSPQNSASWYDPVVLSFDRPVDRESVEAALEITPTVTGKIEWQENTLRFLPTVGWDGNTTYTISLQPSARAADGTPLLRRPIRRQFHTPAPRISVNFGYGPNLQVVDAAGPRLVQFGQWNSTPYVYAALYQVTPEWLLAEYSSSFKGEIPVSTEGLPRVRRWKAATPEGELALPEDLPPGLYVLTIGDEKEEQDTLIVVLTHYTILLKEAGMGRGSSAAHQVAGQVSAIATRAPRAGMTLRIYSRSGRLVGETTSDEQGRFETTVHEDTDPLLVLGEGEGEWTICGFGPEWDATGGWWSWWGWNPIPPAGTRYRVYLYTDRPIYRPGQEVHAKAIVRADDDARYSLLPEGSTILFRLRDARDNILSTQEVPLNALGTAHTSFLLAEGGTLGTYQLEVVVGEEVTRQALKVEAYRKPDYEVTVTTDRPDYLSGEPVTVTVEARYYFGRPAAGAAVSLNLYRSAYDPWSCSWDSGACWVVVQRGKVQGTTDAQGRWQTRITLPDSGGAVETYSLEAVVDDGSGQEVSSHATFQVHRYRQGITILLNQPVYKVGEEIPLRLAVRDYQGNPVAGAAVRVGVYSWNPSTYEYSHLERETTVTTDEEGLADAPFVLLKQGWFRVAATKGDQRVEEWLTLYDPSGQAPWSGADEGGGLHLLLDKSSYAVGEVAQLQVRSPVTGPALLTLERGRVRRMIPIELSDTVTTIPLPIEADFSPNIFVTVQVYRPTDREERHRWADISLPDADLLIATGELSVPVPEKRLQVAITPDRPEYGIREEALITIEVRDGDGRPVQAEVSLAMVDEAIYALSEELVLHPFDAFYQPRPNLVRTYHSLEPVRVLQGGAERGGGGGGMDVGNPRRHFPDTAYWNPTILTDEQGRAVVSIRLPDSLTRWRLTARAVTADTHLGEGLSTLTVTQPLVVRPALPRFLVQGDTFTLTAFLHYDGPAAVPVEAGLLPQGLTPHTPLTHTLTVAAGETAEVAWTLSADTLGPVTLTAYAQGPDLGDAVQHTIPVVPFAIPEVSSFSGEVIGERVERFTLPADFMPEVTALEVRLAPSILSSLLDGLEYLTGYPFG